MLSLLSAEIRKLTGSLAMLLALVAPLMIGALCFLGALAGKRPPSWGDLLQVATVLWTVFMLPMTVTAFSALAAQIEYKGRAWDHLLALPVPRWRVYLAKALVLLATVAAMSGLVLAVALAGGWLGATLSDRTVTGELPLALAARKFAVAVSAAGLMVVLQLWVALRFANFVVPLAFGIGGTLVALAVSMTGAQDANFWPWVIPPHVLMEPWKEARPLFLFGAVGGLVALLAMIVDLSRREMR